MKTTTNDWSTFNWSSSFGPQACCPFLMTRWVLEDFSTTALVVQIIVSIMVTWPLPIARKFPLIVRLVLLVWTNPPLKWVVNGRSNNTVTTQCYHVCLWGGVVVELSFGTDLWRCCHRCVVESPLYCAFLSLIITIKVNFTRKGQSSINSSILNGVHHTMQNLGTVGSNTPSSWRIDGATLEYQVV